MHHLDRLVRMRLDLIVSYLPSVWQVHFGIMVVVMSSEPGNYPFSEPRLIFDYLGYVFTSVLLGLVLHLLVRLPLKRVQKPHLGWS